MSVDQTGMICDSHIHVYGPRDVYPVRNEARYGWYASTLDHYRPFAERAGVKRIVIVQPSIYGTDNRCTLDSAQSLGANGRAVVELDETSVTDEELAAMHAQGARGTRVGVTLSQKPDAEVAQRLIAHIQRTAERVAHLRWHIELLSPAWLTAQLLPVLADLPVDYCLGHLGGMRASDRQAAGDFDHLLKHLGGSAGKRCFVKLSAFYRVSEDSRFEDLMPLVRDLVAAAPDRMLWGTDFPHPRFQDRVTPDSQLDMIHRVAPDTDVRRRIMVDNPVSFYRFET